MLEIYHFWCVFPYIWENECFKNHLSKFICIGAYINFLMPSVFLVIDASAVDRAVRKLTNEFRRLITISISKSVAFDILKVRGVFSNVSDFQRWSVPDVSWQVVSNPVLIKISFPVKVAQNTFTVVLFKIKQNQNLIESNIFFSSNLVEIIGQQSKLRNVVSNVIQFL